MKKYEFDAEIMKQDAQDATYIEFPYDVQTEFGVKGQVKVRATFDGMEYRGSLAKMGTDCHILGITQQIRRAIGKQPGETVRVILYEDTEPRIIEIPDDFRKQLDENEEARAFFHSLSYTNQKKYVLWVSDAKKEETRKNRLEKSMGLLSNKMKHP